ncbi:hypothetical protein J22TS1_09300 [Siminovitchia terrae]|uniref:DUF308 domain-containing protein n=1 Tax=Siminovitchia terrae TaxID=1914933 RepID=UPI001B080AFE|nr:DUF308 domain-containing protein [Siminovitchia terrae]GIN89879.1 hypothetical protein J22TS1_09300 [Siminovitchia terrae]
MGTLFGLIGLIAFIYGIVALIISFVKKRSKKKPAIILVAGFAAILAGGALLDANMTDEERAESKARSEERAKEREEKKAAADAKKAEEKEKEEAKKAEEAAKLKEEEDKKKAAEEKKRKEAEEATKAKEEEKAKKAAEEKAKKEAEEKSKKEKEEAAELERKKKEDAEKKKAAEEEKKKADAEAKKKEKVKEKSATKSIENHIKERTDEEYRKTSISKLQVNENDGDYYVQVFYVWDVKNRAKSTRSMTEMYSEDLAASMKDFDEVKELTVFWEVPYHVEGDNIAKYTFGRNDSGMYFDDVWYAPVIR